LQLSGAFTWTDSRVDTARHGVPAVRPYDGQVITVLATANYNLKGFGRIESAYSFSDGDYGQEHFADGLPLGLEYTRHGVMVGLTRRLSESVGATLRYRYYSYSEPSTGGGNDYTAHGIFATIAFEWK
jgi:hypothetical protein